MGYQPTHNNIKIITPPNPYAGADRIVTVGKNESTCPNCGAPIKGKICSYCRTGFRLDTDRSNSAVVISQAIPGYHSVAERRAAIPDLMVLE